MAEPSLKAGGTGTGLKPVTGPQGLKLAASPFTSAPDEKAAVVDVYDLVKPGVINNGIKEASNLLDDLGGIAGNLGDMAKSAMSSVTDAAKTALDSTKGLQDTIKKNNGIKDNNLICFFKPIGYEIDPTLQSTLNNYGKTYRI